MPLFVYYFLKVFIILFFEKITADGSGGKESMYITRRTGKVVTAS
jgi:hypothetical protein